MVNLKRTHLSTKEPNIKVFSVVSTRAIFGMDKLALQSNMTICVRDIVVYPMC